MNISDALFEVKYTTNYTIWKGENEMVNFIKYFNSIEKWSNGEILGRMS